MTTCSTHVLDAAQGRPAAGIAVELQRDGSVVESALTDGDGRIKFAEPVAAGFYQLSFATGPWFASSGRATFFPSVQLVFEVHSDQPHYHVALLLSPFSYTTYRGS